MGGTENEAFSPFPRALLASRAHPISLFPPPSSSCHTGYMYSPVVFLCNEEGSILASSNAQIFPQAHAKRCMISGRVLCDSETLLWYIHSALISLSNMADKDGRNFRTFYYDTLGLRNVEQRKALEILLKDDPIGDQTLFALYINCYSLYLSYLS